MSAECNDTGTEKKATETCCTPDKMQNVFKRMAACCPGQSDAPDCKAMMERFKDTFCGQKTGKSGAGCNH